MSIEPKVLCIRGRRFGVPTLIVISIVCVATLFRVLLACATPVVVDFSPGSAYDDELFVRLGLSIASGDWLGAYGEITLAKNPGYPIFLALCGVSHIPYQLALILLVVLGAALSAMAVRPLVGNRWVLLAVYLVLLFNPMSFTTAFFRRVYRDCLVIPFAMIALSGYIGLYLRRSKGIKLCLPWSIAAGFATASLQVIKENGLWIAPFAVVCCAVIFGGWVLDARRGDLRARKVLERTLVLLLLPSLCTPLFKGAIKAKNQEVYGVFIMSDRFDGAFSKVCSELSQIDGGTDASSIWVSKEALSLAFNQSPTFSQIQDEVWASWAKWSTLFDGEEVYGDMCYWALMDALDDAGMCSSAVVSSGFWSTVSAELEDALDSGALTSRVGFRISSVAPPVELSKIPSLVAMMLTTSARLGSLNLMDSRLISDYDGVAQISPHLDDTGRAVAALLGDNIIFTTGAEQNAPEAVWANTVDRYLGHGMIAVTRVAFVLLVPCFAFALLTDVLKARKGARLEAALIISGLCLTALAFETAIVYYISYQLGAFDFSSYFNEAYKYSPEFVVALLMAALYSTAIAFGSAARRRFRFSSPHPSNAYD